MTHNEIAIEKQTPKEVKDVNITRNEWLDGVECICPCCDTAHTYVNLNYPNYCDNCGQRLDWSEFKEVEKQCSD